jgi:hypothetical protein
MTRFTPAIVTLSVCVLLGGCAMADFTPYRGAQQKWPVASGTFVETKYAVPVFFGAPDRPYDVLGYLNAETAPARSRRGMVISFMARRAKEVGGNGLILLGTGRQYTGSISDETVTGTVYGSGFTATSFGSSVPMFGGTGTAIVIKLR